MANYDKVFAILKEKGITDEADRHALIKAWTNGRTESLREMTASEIGQFTKALQSQRVISNPADIMRKKVIWLLASLQYYNTKDGKRYSFVSNDSSVPRSNMTDIYAFIKAIGYAKNPDGSRKHFMSYTVQELPKLVTQIEQIKKHVELGFAEKSVRELQEELGV
jgi:hypothetical protein